MSIQSENFLSVIFDTSAHPVEKLASPSEAGWCPWSLFTPSVASPILPTQSKNLPLRYKKSGPEAALVAKR